ncbi:permease [Botrimarina hoheduenensis]|uniref:permease n=1 Tax=Botrimarina hoheduenensis TaxID=2528000 RepID=UPI0018D4CDB2|nr:permease [Botrimarina hoheduenensis]
MAFLVELWIVWCELAPWLLLGAAIAGLLHALLPPGFLERQLNGRLGVVKAVALGVPLPLCSCGVVPVGLSFHRQGAGVGAAVGFLISTPQTGVDSLMVTGSMLGWPFALFKVLVALATGMVGGWLANRFAHEKPRLPILEPVTVVTRQAGWRDALDHADEVLASIWRWLVAGVLIAAALGAWLPPTSLTGLAQQGSLAAIGVTLLAATPLYVCATASVPIAAALAAAGLPIAAVLVFLMAGPATNAATIAALWRGLGGKATAIYLATIIGGSVAGGLFYEALGLPLAGSAAVTHDHAAHLIPGWHQALAIVLALWLARFAWRDVQRVVASRRKPPADGSAPQRYALSGLRCGSCVEKLERALTADSQIATAHVQLKPAVAEVVGDASTERVTQIVTAAGFTVQGKI